MAPSTRRISTVSRGSSNLRAKIIQLSAQSGYFRSTLQKVVGRQSAQAIRTCARGSHGRRCTITLRLDFFLVSAALVLVVWPGVRRRYERGSRDDQPQSIATRREAASCTRNRNGVGYASGRWGRNVFGTVTCIAMRKRASATEWRPKTAFSYTRSIPKGRQQSGSVGITQH